MQVDDHCKRLSVGVGPPWEPQKGRIPWLVPEPVRVPINNVCRGICPWPLFLTGETGSGKTCAALLLLDFYHGWYSTASDWHKRVCDAEAGRLQYSSGYPETSFELWRAVPDRNLWVLDELGLRSDVTDPHCENVHKLLDKREGLPTVVISNRSLDEIASIYGGPIASRLDGGTRVKFPSVDLRARRIGNGAV